MQWQLCLWLALLLLTAAVVLAVRRGRTPYKHGRLFDPIRILFAGVGLATLSLLIPLYAHELQGSGSGWVETLFLSVYTMIRMFLVDGDIGFVTQNIADLSGGLYVAYSVLFSVLFLVAPFLTFGVVLSFFKSAAAYLRLLTCRHRQASVFSAFNEQSLTLAESLHEDGGVLLFAVGDGTEEPGADLEERARQIGALFIKKEAAGLKLPLAGRWTNITYFLMDENQTVNADQAIRILREPQHPESRDYLFVFSSRPEAEPLLSGAFRKRAKKTVRVRCVNEVKTLVNRTLFSRGYELLFRDAPMGEDGKKRISALVVGLGQHGTEMVRTLPWFCQMDGYHVEINAFDADMCAEARLASLCPELMDARFNGHFDSDDEAQYKITVHPGVDVTTKFFDDAVLALPPVTYVLVALGDDDKNTAAAIKLRALCARMGWQPHIQAIVHDGDKAEALGDITNHKGQTYDIDFIGDLKSTYSADAIVGQPGEQQALERHLKWGGEEEWNYEYFYQSSLASAIHKEMKRQCGIPGIEKAPGERTQDELWAIRRLEHRRWNAYMRSEGYVYAPQRNDLAKMHPCLVPFGALSPEEQQKDDD